MYRVKGGKQMKMIKKLKSLRKNERGFTLVELVVATAVLGIISVAVLNMMSAGSSMFNGVQKRTMTLFKSQVASVQLKAALSNASDAIAVDGTTLYIADAANGKLSTYRYNSADKTIYYTEDTYEKNGALLEVTEGSYDDGTANIPFCYNVAYLSYIINSENVDDTSHISAIRFDITTTKLDQSTTRKETISLRSNPLYIGEADEGMSIKDTLVSRVWG